MNAPLRILTWHVHGDYLYSLTHLPHEFVVPFMEDNRPGYAPLSDKIPWRGNVRMVPATQLRNEQFDCVIYQSRVSFEQDRFQLLTPDQRALPSVYIEHNPPEPHPTDTPHFFRHGRGMLIHVTHYNALMWDSGGMPTRVVEHGVPERTDVRYSGELARGIVVIDNLHSHGRLVGADIYAWAHERIPLDLIGMGAEALPGGIGEAPNMDVPSFMSRYRFFFTPVRYVSLEFSVVQAMMAGMPIVGIAATELNDVIDNERSGYVDTRPSSVVEVAQHLLHDAGLARRWGAAAKETARRRFSIKRFVADWDALFEKLMGAEHD